MSQIILELFENAHQWKTHQWNPHEPRTRCNMREEESPEENFSNDEIIHLFNANKRAFKNRAEVVYIFVRKKNPHSFNKNKFLPLLDLEPF